jgi:hypothetical protein
MHTCTDTGSFTVLMGNGNDMDTVMDMELGI